MIKLKRQAALTLPILLALVGTAQAGETDNIGVAAAVKDNVHATMDGQTKPLGAGNDLYQNEVVATDEKSMAQLLFLDQTSLSVGPKSEVKLDKFVYDPNRKQGDVVLAATRGAFRFVTGAQDPRSYTLKTPVATIGVRGTIVDYGVENGRLIIRLVEGKALITLDSGKVITLDHPGDALVIRADGAIIGPTPWDGEIHSAMSGTSFPLYGSQFSGVPRETLDNSTTSDHTKLADELAQHNVIAVSDPVTKPTPPSGGASGGNDGPGEGEGSGDGPGDGEGGHHHHHNHHHHHHHHHGDDDDDGWDTE